MLRTHRLGRFGIGHVTCGENCPGRLNWTFNTCDIFPGDFVTLIDNCSKGLVVAISHSSQCRERDLSEYTILWSINPPENIGTTNGRAFPHSFNNVQQMPFMAPVTLVPNKIELDQNEHKDPMTNTRDQFVLPPDLTDETNIRPPRPFSANIFDLFFLLVMAWFMAIDAMNVPAHDLTELQGGALGSQVAQ